jgi:DNA polymerase-3 subunit epsilon
MAGLPRSWATGEFAAIDFETADHKRDSACSVGIVRVRRTRVVRRVSYLIRPPRRDFVFTHIHGITWPRVADAPSFRALWPTLKKELEGVEFLAAHNAPFDRSVLAACCESSNIRVPALRFVCTMDSARAVWSIYPTQLPDVCRRLDLALNHHDALADAEACANIIVAAGSCSGCSDAGRCYPARATCANRLRPL